MPGYRPLRVGSYSGVNLLSNANPTLVSIVANPLASYGSIGTNDSGLQMPEASGMRNYTFTMDNTTGYTVALYGTNHPNVQAAWQGPNAGPSGGPQGSTIVPAKEWFLLPGPTDQAGAGGDANPMTSTTPQFQTTIVVAAVRAVVILQTTATGTLNVTCMASY